ncbi:amiloride-sensitive sodium channel pickpocket 17 [Rhipicephalus microplus]|uniref:amiloride-sensitive sodium channel pickpocket 17 n=1 Tax=Rhipicephalus microplus TaxID=6941 RepID=UPI003F6D90CB
MYYIELRASFHASAVHVPLNCVLLLLQGVAGPINENGPPARLVLYFNSLTYEHVRSMPKYDETHVLGNLGGIIGMYLGLSFFVLFQVLDILVVGTLRLKKMLH